jgi:hypothetical protein
VLDSKHIMHDFVFQFIFRCIIPIIENIHEPGVAHIEFGLLNENEVLIW